jgi:hypothetical protein
VKYLLSVIVLASGLAVPLPPGGPRVLAASPNPGVVFELEIVASSGATPRTMGTFIEGLNARMSLPGQGGQTDVIYRGDRREMLLLNHGARSYTVLDEAAMKKLGAQLGQVMAQMDQMMKSLPESQRAAMEQMMKGRMGGAATPAAPVEIRRTSERATHSGFATTKYELVRSGRVIQELWVTPWSAIDGAAEARPVFESMADFFKVIQENLKQLTADASSEAYSRMREIDGYPVVGIVLDEQGKAVSRSTLLSVKRQAVPAAQFEAPAGYRPQTMPGM